MNGILVNIFRVKLIFLLLLFTQLTSSFAQAGGRTIESLTSEEIQKGKALLEKKEIQGNPQSDLLEKIDSPSSSKIPTEAKEPAASPMKQTSVASEKRQSHFEAYLSGNLPGSISLNIEQFGYNLFQQSPATFAPVDLIPVSPDYLLGPGDEIRINIWGKVNVDHTVVLDRDGKVVLPQFGTLHLAGLSFSEARNFLKNEFSRFYNPSEVKMNVSMGQLRSIRLFVVGKANHPGSYTLSSFSTLINALFAAGGPGKIGSMRDIMVKRKGETIVHFDLYDFLLKGDKGGDIQLMSEDVIFIPTVGPLIGIAGNVKAPAIYESKEKLTLRGLINMAGGISATGYLQRVQVERIFDNRAKTILDINLKKLSDKINIPLMDGDLVKIFSIHHDITNSVILKGNVIRPGIYEWQKGMRLNDLIKTVSDFLPDTFLEFALIERIVAPDQHKEYFSINLEILFLEGDEKENILLQPHDKILIFNRWDLVEREMVQLDGSVNKPGPYEFRPNMRLSDLFNLAGGLKRPKHPKSYQDKGMITRRMPPDFHEEKLSFDFKGAIVKQSEVADLLLEPMDQVRIFDIWELAQDRKVHIVGAVIRPGEYTWIRKMRLSDLLNLAGGPKKFAFLESAELTRIAPKPEGPIIERIDINLGEAIKENPEHNLILKEDDHLSVKTVPEWELYRTVRIVGEVRFPGSYTSKKGERLASLIKRAGGYTENAYLKGAIFTRESVREIQQRHLDDAIDRLEQQLLSKSAATIEAALTPEAAAQHKGSMEQRQALIARMRTAKTKGRMALQLDDIETFQAAPSNILLEDGDQLIIPERPQQVQVIGAVYNQTAFIFDRNKTASKYLNNAGGLTDDADEEAVYILKVDGTALSNRQTSGFWSKSLMSKKLDPGDTIVVPEEIDKIAWLRETKDVTEIFYQLALTTGVLIALF